MPAAGIVPLDQKAVEWVRRERNEATRRWMVIGPFPNWGNKGHATAYPPEQTLDFDAMYPGWYNPVTWKPWHAKREDGYVVDFQEAFTPVYEYYPRFDNGTGYAYAEFASDKRDTATLRIGLQDATKVWLNGKLIHESTAQIPHDQFKKAPHRSHTTSSRPPPRRAPSNTDATPSASKSPRSPAPSSSRST
ncbi:MAG: hypothetical protein NTU83_07685 [Candidatus Hydrogenedentes bacterium]|nr:hypothetical protein [Candidatus Hydrogenedentota bacterium]